MTALFDVENARLTMDVIKVTFFLGCCLAIIYKRRIGVSPGGVVAPGILGIVFYQSPWDYLVILLASLFISGFSRMFIYKYILDNRYRRVLVIAASVVLCSGINAIFFAFQRTDAPIGIMSFILPALFAISTHRYGTKNVLIGLLCVTFVTYCVALLLWENIPYSVYHHATQSVAYYEIKLSEMQMLIQMPLALLFELLLIAKFNVRTGGYMLAPLFMTILRVCPTQFKMLTASIVVCYAVVKLLMHFSLLTGLNRFATCILLGTIFSSLCDNYAFAHYIPNYQLSHFVTTMIIAVVVNDLCLQSLRKSAIGMIPNFIVNYFVCGVFV